MPKDGGWTQQQVFNAIAKSPKYNSTGGWGDHVALILRQRDEGEWLDDPYNTGFGEVPMGGGKSHSTSLLSHEKKCHLIV